MKTGKTISEEIIFLKRIIFLTRFGSTKRIAKESPGIDPCGKKKNGRSKKTSCNGSNVQRNIGKWLFWLTKMEFGWREMGTTVSTSDNNNEFEVNKNKNTLKATDQYTVFYNLLNLTYILMHTKTAKPKKEQTLSYKVPSTKTDYFKEILTKTKNYLNITL